VTSAWGIISQPCPKVWQRDRCESSRRCRSLEDAPCTRCELPACQDSSLPRRRMNHLGLDADGCNATLLHRQHRRNAIGLHTVDARLANDATHLFSFGPQDSRRQACQVHVRREWQRFGHSLPGNLPGEFAFFTGFASVASRKRGAGNLLGEICAGWIRKQRRWRALVGHTLEMIRVQQVPVPVPHDARQSTTH